MPEKSTITLETVNETVQEILRKMESFHVETQGRFTTLEGTVNRMAVFVARIPEIEARLTALESRMKALETRMDNLEGLYQHLDKRWEILYHEYVSMSAALKRLEERFDKLEADQLRDRVRILEEKVTALEKNTVH